MSMFLAHEDTCPFLNRYPEDNGPHPYQDNGLGEKGFESYESFVFLVEGHEAQTGPQSIPNTILSLHKEMSELKKVAEKKVNSVGEGGDGPPPKRRKESFCQNTLRTWNLLWSCVHSMKRFLAHEHTWTEFKKYMEDNYVERHINDTPNIDNEVLPF